MATSTQKNCPLPRLIAWEVTRRCNLSCRHCRAAAENREYADEMTTQESLSILDNIAGFSQPIIILTGGEPMLRDDIYQIATHGHELGLRMVMAPCGALMDEAAVLKMQQAGIQCISLSLDGATAASHDGFRCVPGAFDTVLQAAGTAQKLGLPFQINTTITRHNLLELPDIMSLAERLGAITFNPFLLVPVGRGEALADQEITPAQYEETLQWLSQQRGKTRMQLRVTCAPHYQRIIRQAGSDSCGCSTGSDIAHHAKRPERSGRPERGEAGGCMGGKGFAFISHVGKVQICGFLETEAGDLRQNRLDFEAVWKNSEFLQRIRNVDGYQGKCGYCEYRRLCGGCRARAWAMTDDYLASEPYCVYEPPCRTGRSNQAT